MPKKKTIDFTARLESENWAYVRDIANTEGISKAQALNLIISRQNHYPKDWLEIAERVTVLSLNLKEIKLILEECAALEARIEHLLECPPTDNLGGKKPVKEMAQVKSPTTPAKLPTRAEKPAPVVTSPSPQRAPTSGRSR